MEKQQATNIETTSPVASLSVLMLGVAAIFGGVLLATWLLPGWLPGLAGSIDSEAPKVFWYLSRGSAMVAFALLWASMAIGLLITNRMARLWPGGPAAFDLHQYVSLLGLGFALFHALILMGDEYIQFTLMRVLIPFTSQEFKPVWVGLGQIGFYIWALLIGSFYVRRKLGNKAWRWIHFSSFLTFAMVLVHGFASGSDSQTIWAAGMYWAAGGSVLFLLYYRILVTVGAGRGKQTRAVRAQTEAEVQRATR
jgi:predicted ferric reductase